ncbi:MAG: YkgJ family cysteine cluster protein [Candidatus Melainabacteria bacterium]|nr:YkgJ family cysteine cluster protein [Candidatus Melainabacteria bacterium]
MEQAAKNLKSLEMLASTDSGYRQLEQESESEKNQFKFLTLLTQGKYQELDALMMENPHLIDTVSSKAIFLLNILLRGQKIIPMHISIRKPAPALIDDLSYALIELYQNMHKLFEIAEIDFYQQLEVLPNLAIYFSDYLLKNVILREQSDRQDLLNKTKAIIFDDTKFADLVDENLRAQQYRLQALYYRRLGQDEAAEQAIAHYSENFQAGTSYHLEKLHTEFACPSQEVLPQLGKIYQEVDAIQSEVLVQSGIYRDTCFYYQCTDCCKRDFPTVSLTEFLHIKNNLSKAELEKFKTRAQAIQDEHIKEFGEPMKIVDQTTSSKENPHEFKFTCPFLNEADQCEIHSDRPLACRSFGLATINNQDVQACKFYLNQYQANSSHRAERIVYDSRETTAMIGGSNKLLAQEHGFKNMKQPVGTLVAWLCLNSKS